MNSHQDDNFKKMCQFIEKIGIEIDFCAIDDPTFLPGLKIDNGVLKIDLDKLTYIGDTLHEAGHIALSPINDRSSLSGKLEGQIDPAATEMAVIAWSYAACLEIGIDPAVVFHPEGYKGDSQQILFNFGNGQYFGVPILEWYGMTERRSNDSGNFSLCYPKMTTWIKPETKS